MLNRLTKALRIERGKSLTLNGGYGPFQLAPPDGFRYPPDAPLTPAQAFQRNAAVRSVITLLANAVQEADFKVEYDSLTRGVIPSTKPALQNALDAPGYRFSAAADILVFGEHIAVQKGGYEFVRIPPAQATDHGEGSLVTGWTISDRDYAPEDIVHIKAYDPAGRRRGVSPLDSLADVLSEDRAAWQQQRLKANNADVYVARPLEAPMLNDDGIEAQAAIVARALRGEGTGYGHPGIAVLTEGETLGALPDRSAGFAETRRLVMDAVCSTYNVSSAMLALGSSDRNLDSSTRTFAMEAVRPLANLLAASYTAQSVPVFYSGERDAPDRISVTADLSDRLRDRQSERFKSYAIAIEAGFLTPAQVRELEGMGDSA